MARRGVAKRFQSKWWFVALLAAGALAPREPVYSQGSPELVDRLRPSIALVLVSGDWGKTSGTAFAIHSDGLFATAFHVVEDAKEVLLQLHGGQSFSADVVAGNPEADLAILRIARTGLTPLPILDASAIRQGEDILVIGFPLSTVLGNYDVTVTRGIVSAVRSQLGLIQVDAAMNPGVSGGPVVNLRGQVVGVAVSALRTSQQVNFASPSWVLKSMLDSLIGQPIAALARLRLPLIRPVEVELRAGKTMSANAQGTEVGVACIAPPPTGRSITAVRGNLDIPGNVMAIVWLSLREGVASFNDPRAFGHLFADRRVNSYEFTERRTAISLTDLNLPAEQICASQTFKSPGICVNCRFEARYMITYKVPSLRQ